MHAARAVDVGTVLMWVRLSVIVLVCDVLVLIVWGDVDLVGRVYLSVGERVWLYVCVVWVCLCLGG